MARVLKGGGVILLAAASIFFCGCSRRLRPNQFTEAYIRDLQYGDTEKKREAARSLSIKRSASDPFFAVPALIKGLDDPDPEVALTSYTALQALTDRTDIPRSSKAWNEYWETEKKRYAGMDETERTDALAREKASAENTRGMMELRARNFAAAEESFKNAIDLDPRPTYHSNLARCYICEGRNRDAIVKCVDATDANSSYGEGWYNMGDAYRLMPGVDYSYEAVESYEKALAVDTSRTDLETRWALARIYHSRAVTLANDYYYLRAAYWINDAIRAAIASGAEANTPGLHVTAALVHYGLGQYYQAYVETERVRELGYEWADSGFISKLYERLREMGFTPGEPPVRKSSETGSGSTGGTSLPGRQEKENIAPALVVPGI